MQFSTKQYLATILRNVNNFAAINNLDQVVFWKKLLHFFEKIVSVKLEVLGKVLRKVLMIGFYKWTSIFVTFCYSYFMQIPDI